MSVEAAYQAGVSVVAASLTGESTEIARLAGKCVAVDYHASESDGFGLYWWLGGCFKRINSLK